MPRPAALAHSHSDSNPGTHPNRRSRYPEVFGECRYPDRKKCDETAQQRFQLTGISDCLRSRTTPESKRSSRCSTCRRTSHKSSSPAATGSGCESNAGFTGSCRKAAQE
jgi:hypothetical protein